MNPLILSFLGIAFNDVLNKRPIPTCFCCQYPESVLYVFFLGASELPEVVIAERKTAFCLIDSEATIVASGIIPNLPFQFPEGKPVITISSPSLLVGKQRKTVKKTDKNAFHII